MAQGDSAIEICNIGLIAIGEDPIVSFSDNSKASGLCSARYDQLRRLCLRKHTWVFARKRTVLAAAAQPPAFGWSNAYGLPGDYIRMVDIPDMIWSSWQVEGQQLLTNWAGSSNGGANVIYIRDVTDPTVFDPEFVQALGECIGWQLAWPLTQDKSVQASAMQRFNDALDEARSTSSQEDSPKEFDDDVLLPARQRGY